MKPMFFSDPSEFRSWLEANHDKATELWVGFRKKASGKPSITWPEAVDQALCFGWIDSVRRSIDDSSYTNRFTPRQPRSTWSAVNIRRVEELKKLGLMHPAGLAAFKRQSEGRSGIYSYEQRKSATLDEAHERRFRANGKAWAFFQSQPAWYRAASIWWVVSAKREETRDRRLSQLIESSERGQKVPPLTRPAKSG
jgi:uncharacterized protein YdeI (YjbR/CyaY-like superfamily)